MRLKYTWTSFEIEQKELSILMATITSVFLEMGKTKDTDLWNFGRNYFVASFFRTGHKVNIQTIVFSFKIKITVLSYLKKHFGLV